MRKFCNGQYIEMTAEELAAMKTEEELGRLRGRCRSMTESEVVRLVIAGQINSLKVDDATASRMAEFYPVLAGDGALIAAGTKINWGGVLKRAAADLWDTAENDPDHASALWEDIAYREGVRVIPETITAAGAFALGELGWWEEAVYRSLLEANVYTPTAYPDGWEKID